MKPNVFIFFLDTVRVDQLKGAGASGEPENFLEKVLHKGTFFHNFIVAGNSTRISVNALFNGFFGGTSGLNYHYQCDEDFKNSQVVTLADVFKYHGYRTLAVSQGDVYLPTWSFDQFRIFQESFDLEGLETEVADASQPLFAYLHFSNLHDLAFGAPEQMTADNYRQHLQELASEMEAVWNRLVKEEDIVVIVSDHGCNLREAFDPDWRFFYEEEPTGGIFLRDVTIRGICSIVAPKLFPVRRVNELVRGIDIFPTLLDALELLRPAVQGCSLWEEIKSNKPLPAMHAYAEAGGVRMADGEAVCRCIRNNRWKFNRYEIYGEQLFDLSRDPDEQHNLIGSGQPQEAHMRRLFSEQVAENRQGAESFYAQSDPMQQRMLANRELPIVVKGGRTSCFQGLIDERVCRYLAEHIARQFSSWGQKGERIVVYSASEHARALFDAASPEVLAMIFGVVDSNPSLSGSRFCDVPVYSLSDFEQRAAPTMIIVAHHFFANDMYLKIKEACCQPIPVFNLYHLDREIPLWWDRDKIDLKPEGAQEMTTCR